MSSLNGEDQFICPAGRPVLPCPALPSGQGRVRFFYESSSGQGRAGRKKETCAGLCFVAIS